MWQTPHTRHPQRTPRRGAHVGLLACAVTLLLAGVVIGRVSSRSGVDEVYLRNSEPTPSPTKTSGPSPRNRPPLDHVARAGEPPAAAQATPTTRPPTRKPSTMIDGSDGGSQWNTFAPGYGDESGAAGGGTGGDTGGTDGGTAALTSLESEVIRLANAERRQRGCAPMRIDKRLVRSARQHSREMAASNAFEHASPDGRSPWDRMEAAGYQDGGAENIARGYHTAREAIQGWMASSGHRRNILNCSLVATGVGVDMGPGGPWWTQDFGYS
ncbi:CAP domain-containing protein [Microtetraspora sp. AC03309]|uniref:CAP domain-containing protein n=1 Tax=Microtetraspora sp. AC03309 TaxID=2779376 RepID=UPI001E568274|nr:CAP domain-containing protein [Microtetraspora sp. AC03309]MCC5579292.1 CAP domain-containing protein [Microtetraspora sp. AC03309]